MYRYDYTDIFGGLLLISIGAGVSALSLTSYPLGSLGRMGPGMFPAALGAVLAALGLILTLQALRRQGSRPDIRVFSPILILASVAVFALLMSPFGMIPAIVMSTIIASLAELRVRAGQIGLLCLVLSVFAPVVFVYCLGLRIPLVNWPF